MLNRLLQHTKETNPLYKDSLRTRRKPLLEAFDIYKSNVNYGIVEETETEKTMIMSWYQKLLNLDEGAINNAPSQIMRYLK